MSTAYHALTKRLAKMERARRREYLLSLKCPRVKERPWLRTTDSYQLAQLRPLMTRKGWRYDYPSGMWVPMTKRQRTAARRLTELRA